MILPPPSNDGLSTSAGRGPNPGSSDRQVRFCIFTTQRSGSTWLIDLLDSVAGVRAFGEVFLDRGDRVMPPEVAHLEPPRGSARGHRGRIGAAFHAARLLHELGAAARGAEAVGFKLMYDQLWSRPELLVPVVAGRTRIIHLIRENVLATVMSQQLARERNLYHTTGRLPASPRLRLDPTKLVGQLESQHRRLAMARLLIRLLPVRTATVRYEALLADPGGELRDLLAFLGVRRAAVARESLLKRVSPEPIRDRIANLDEVERCLAGTSFAWCLGPPA